MSATPASATPASITPASTAPALNTAASASSEPSRKNDSVRDRVVQILDMSPDLIEWYLLNRGDTPRLLEILDKKPEFVEAYLLRTGQALRLAGILDKRLKFLEAFLDKRPKFIEAYLLRRGDPLGSFVDKHPVFISNYLSNPKDRPSRRDAFKRVVEKHPKLLDDYLLSKNPVLGRFMGLHSDYVNKCLLCRKRALAKCVDKHPDYINDYLLGRKPASEYSENAQKDVLTEYLLDNKAVVVHFLDNHTSFIDDYLKHRPAYLTNHLHYNCVSSAYIPPSFFTVPFTESLDIFEDFIEDLPALSAPIAAPESSNEFRSSAPTTTTDLSSTVGTNTNCPPVLTRVEGSKSQREAPSGSSNHSNRSRPQSIITTEPDEKNDEPEDDEDDEAEEESKNDDDTEEEYKDDDKDDDEEDDDDDEDYGGRPTSRSRSDHPPPKTPQPFMSGMVRQATVAPSAVAPSTSSSNRSLLITSSSEQPDGQLMKYPASPRLLNASQGQSPGPKNSWRLFDEDRAIYHMLCIKDEKTLVQDKKKPNKQILEPTFKGESRFEEVSRRMKSEELDRSWVSIRNQWNRTLRARSGFDERKNKQAPLATSKQGKKAPASTRQRKTTARQETATSGQTPAVVIYAPPATSQGSPLTTIDPALLGQGMSTTTQAPTTITRAPTPVIQAPRPTSQAPNTKKRQREPTEEPEEDGRSTGISWDDDDGDAHSSEDDEAFARRLANGLRPRKRR